MVHKLGNKRVTLDLDDWNLIVGMLVEQELDSETREDKMVYTDVKEQIKRQLR